MHPVLKEFYDLVQSQHGTPAAEFCVDLIDHTCCMQDLLETFMEGDAHEDLKEHASNIATVITTHFVAITAKRHSLELSEALSDLVIETMKVSGRLHDKNFRYDNAESIMSRYGRESVSKPTIN